VGAGVVHDTADARIEAFHTDHGVPSVGFVLHEDDRPGAFDVAAAEALGVPAGPLFGILQRGEHVVASNGATVTPDQVMGGARQGRTVVFSGDTRPCEATADAATGADLLVHEGTFLSDERDRAVETRHSTVAEAAALARDADVALLALTHLSSRFLPRDARAEAEGIFTRVVVPRDFDRIEIPYPERGEPRLVRPERDAGEREQQPPAG